MEPVRYTSPCGGPETVKLRAEPGHLHLDNGVTFITTKASAIIRHGNLCRGLDYVSAQASGHITPFLDVSSSAFDHGLPERHSPFLSRGMSGGEVKTRA